MAHNNSEDLDRILDEMDVNHVPAEFVKSARIVYAEGETVTITPEKLEDIMNDDNSLEELGISNIGLVLDLEVMKSTIRKYSEIILRDITV